MERSLHTLGIGKKLLIGLSLGAMLLLNTINLQAAAPGKLNKATKEMIRGEISSRIICPAFVTENNQVKALVRINKHGLLDIIKVETNDDRLKDYVISELKKIKPAQNGTGDMFVVVINFQIV